MVSQVLACVSWRYLESENGGYEFPPQPGLTQGIASIMAAYMADGIEIANGQGVHGDLGHGNPVGDGSFGLGLTSDMFGLSIQALSEVDPSSSVILAQGWSDHLTDYLGRRWAEQYGGKSQSEVAGGIQDFLTDHGDSPERDWLQSAVDWLDFIGDNARWPYVDHDTGKSTPVADIILLSVLSAAAGLVIGAVSAEAGVIWTLGGLAVTILGDVVGSVPDDDVDVRIGGAVTGVADGARDVWAAWLTEMGYFTPESIAGWEGHPHYVDPFQPGTNGTPAITQDENGVYHMDTASDAAQDWLAASGVDRCASDAVAGPGTKTMSKYDPLWKHIQADGRSVFRLSFDEIAESWVFRSTMPSSHTRRKPKPTATRLEGYH